METTFVKRIAVPAQVFRVARARPSPEQRRGAAIFVAATLLFACDEPGRNAAISPGASPAALLDHSPFNPVRVEGRLLSSSAAIGEPTDLYLAGTVLWVTDAESDPGLHALDAESGRHLYSFGPRGQGPGDFMRKPWGLARDYADPTGVVAFDLGLQRLTHFAARPFDSAAVRIVKIGGAPRVSRIVRVSQSRYIAEAFSDTSRFAIIDSSGARIRSVPGELFGPDSLPLALRVSATRVATQLCSWDGKGLVVTSSEVGRMDFLDMDAKLVRRARLPFSSDPEFVAGTDGQLAFIYRRIWYLHCTTNADHVFALFSGIPYDDSLGYEESGSASFVHVLNWDGELVGVYQLSHAATSIAVDQAGTMLYASSLADAGIYRYSLPRLRGR